MSDATTTALFGIINIFVNNIVDYLVAYLPYILGVSGAFMIFWMVYRKAKSAVKGK